MPKKAGFSAETLDGSDRLFDIYSSELLLYGRQSMEVDEESVVVTPAVETLISNERTKLLANALNTAATSSFAVGVLAPIAAAIYYATGSHMKLRIILVGVAIWLSTAGLLHLAARRVLGGLRA